MQLQEATPIEFNDGDVASITKLASLNTDSAQMFKTASDETSDETLKKFFLQCYLVRTEFASDFKRLLKDSESEPPPNGSVTRVLHQWWLEIRELLTHAERHAIVDELRRNEEIIKTAYESAFASVKSPLIHDVIESHYEHIRTISNAIMHLAERTKGDRT